MQQYRMWKAPMDSVPRGLPELTFGEGKQGRKQEVIQNALATLEDAGVNDKTMREQWGVRLWTIKPSDSGLKLKVDISKNPKVDLKALTQWLQEMLKPFGAINLKIRERRECCHKQCGGCLLGNPPLKRQWLS